MSIISAVGATFAVATMVNNLNRILYECGDKPAARAGEKREHKRLKEQAKRMKPWLESAKAASAGQPVSRQVRRRMKRYQEKSLTQEERRQAIRGAREGIR